MRNRLYFRVQPLILLFFSNLAFSNPFLNSSYFSIYDSLVGAGVSSDNAMKDADRIVKSSFFPDHKFDSSGFSSSSGFGGSSSSSDSGQVSSNFKDSVLGDRFSKGFKERIEMTTPTKKNSYFYNASHYGNDADRKLIEQYFEDFDIKAKFVEESSLSDIEKDLKFFKDNPMYINGEVVNNAFSSGDLDIAPAWYGLLGRRVYRTYDKFLTYKGEDLYVYFDNPFDAYKWGAELSFFPLTYSKFEVEVYPREGDKEYKLDIYEEIPTAYDDERDASLSDEDLFFTGVKRVKEATYSFFLKIYALGFNTTLEEAKDYYSEQKEYCEDQSQDDADIKNSVLNCLSLHKQEMEGDELTGKLRYVQTLQYDNPDDLPINADEEYEYNKHNRISDLEKSLNSENFRDKIKDYIVSDQSQADLMNDAISKADFSSADISDESREVISRGELKITPETVSNARNSYSSSSGSSSSSGGGAGASNNLKVSGSDLLKDRSSSWDSFFSGSSSRSRRINASRGDTNSGESVGSGSNNIGGADTNSGENAEASAGSGSNNIGGSDTNSGASSGNGSSSIGGSDTNSGANAGASSGSGSGSIGGSDTNAGAGAGASSGSGSGSIGGSDTNAGAGAGANAGASAGAGAGANTGTKTGEIAGENAGEGTKDKDEDEGLNLPDLEEFDVLKPIRDWKNEILSSVTGSSITGTCPDLSIQIFSTSISTDAHCQVFESISGIISAFSVVIWLILAFRILLSA